jgi:hypothetical protein
MLSEAVPTTAAAAGGCCSDICSCSDPCHCGIIDLLREHWKWVMAILWILGVCLLVPGIVQHEADYGRFYILNGFEITDRWVEGPRIRCPYGDKFFDCYDGLVMGNYTWNNMARHCRMNITTDYQADDVQSYLLHTFPYLGVYSMWSASPEKDNQCERQVNPHWLLIGFGIVFSAIALIATLIAIITCCRQRMKQHTRNVRNLNIKPPSLRLNSAQLTLAAYRH